MNRSLTYGLCLLCFYVSGMGAFSMREHRPPGVRVLLGKSCPDSAESNRLLVVRYLPGNRFWLNDQSLSEAKLRQSLSAALERRIEKIVWVAADERVTYGDVVEVVSKLQRDTPDLHIALPTETQIGPVDPLEIERMNGRRADGSLIGVMPCVFL